MVLQNKSDNSSGHALLYCQIRMVLQNKLDNSNGQWTCTKMVKFPFEVDVYRRNVPIFAKTSWESENFRETKFRENLLIFSSFSLFAKMEKTVFVSTLVNGLTFSPEKP
jgi:hypothetical protein